MAESKNTKRALAASIGCVALCSAMLVGTTFAWFTDTASTSINKIQSGTLDVALVDSNGDELTEGLKFQNVNGSSDILWEPGATFKTQGFKVNNFGSLAIKYKLTIDGLDGESELLKAIDFSVVDASGTAVELSTFEGNLSAQKTSDVYYIQAKMKETAGNEYQGMTLDGIKLTVSATQYTEEFDSYNNTYDKNAEYATPVSTVDELAAAIANGEDVVLKNDVELPADLAITGDVTIYGNGSSKLTVGDGYNRNRLITVNDTDSATLTLSGVEIEGDSLERGFSVFDNKNLTIVMDNCSTTADHYAFLIGTGNDNINIVVRNTTLTGYAALQTWSSGTNVTFENCVLEGVNKWAAPTSGNNKANNDYATIVTVHSLNDEKVEYDASNSNLTFKNCVISATEQNTAKEYFLDIDGSNNTVTFENCQFVYNGSVVTGEENILSHMEYVDGTTITIK